MSSSRTLPAPAAIAALLGLLLLVAWDAAGLDLRVAAWAGQSNGFPWRDHWLLTGPLHDGARAAVALLLLWPLSALRWPTGVLRGLPPARIWWLVGTTLGGMLLVSSIKHHSLTSCPWDLQQFGGTAHHISHWVWGRADGGPGHCFPAGHASGGFAWVAGYFALRDRQPTAARWWLAAALAAGALMGLAQQLRGAHFASHTLWTAWLCWTWAWACSAFLARERHAAAAG